MRDLSNNHRVMLYHGMGHMISAASTDQIGFHMVESLTGHINADWVAIMNQANQDNTCLVHSETVRTIDYLLKINQKIASSAESYYTYYLKKIFTDLINIYRLYTQMIQE